VAELHCVKVHEVAAILTVGVRSLTPKFRPEMVTVVPALTAPFACPREKLIVGASKLNIATEVPTTEATVSLPTTATAELAAGLHWTVVAELHPVVVHIASSSEGDAVAESAT
jgi:hypothetical protein